MHRVWSGIYSHVSLGAEDCLLATRGPGSLSGINSSCRQYFSSDKIYGLQPYNLASAHLNDSV